MKIDSARVRALRERRAWSQEQLAQVAGLNVRTVQRIESGGSASLETRMALAVAFEVTPEALCEAVPAPAAEPLSAAPPQAPRQAPKQAQQNPVPALLVILIVILVVGLGYQIGKDLADKHNRADCEAAGRMDCR